MIRFHQALFAAVLGGLGLFAFGPTAARADIDISGTPAGGGVFDYTVTLTGATAQLKTNDFFVLYDFDGYKPGSAHINSSSFTWAGSVANLGPYLTLDHYTGDLPNVPNLAWKYTGATTLTSASGDVVLGSFEATSVDNSDGLIHYGAASHDTKARTTHGLVNKLDTVSGPLNTAPEPSTLALVGIGFPLIGFFFLRRRTARTLPAVA